MTVTSLSIVIPYYNDRTAVVRCLQSIRDALAPLPPRYPTPEIVLVDDHSPDPFDPESSPVELRVLRLPENRGVGAARNMGVALSHGSHLLFLDSDVMLDRLHLTRLYELLEETDARIIQGPTSVIPANFSPSMFHRYMAASWNYYEHNNWEISVFTQCFCVEKKFFDELGGFSERYERSGGEEFELGLRLNALKSGFIHFDERLVHFHHFDGPVKRMKKVYLRSRYIGSIALRMPNLPFRFTAQSLMRSAYAWVLNGFAVLALVSPKAGSAGWILAALLFYVSDLTFSSAMEKAHSRQLAWMSVVFRQLEYSFINLGMLGGLFLRGIKDKT